MKNILLLFICLFLLSCNNNEKKVKGDLPFFHFDQIDYYYSDISREEETELGNNNERSRQEKALCQILYDRVPVSTLDTLFIKNMAILSFNKRTIDPKLNSKISHLFSLRTSEIQEVTACAPTYRDILIFRKKGKVIGVAKICFSCNQNHIIGARYDSSNFGQNGEYAALYNILQACR